VFDYDDISFNDLLDEPSSQSTAPATLDELLANGFPVAGGVADLAALAQLPDPGARHSALRQKYLKILELQQRAA
jgi:hypothetical protein